MKGMLIKSVRYIVFIAVVGLLAWYVVTNWESFLEISISQPAWLLASAVFLIGNIYSVAVATELAIEPHNVFLKRSEAFGLMSITRFSNQFAPNYISTAIRAAYLKRKHKVSYTKFSSSFIITNTLQLLFSGAAILVTYFFINSSAANVDMIWIVAGFLLFFVAILYIPLDWLENLGVKLEKKTKNRIVHRLRLILTEYIRVRSYSSLFIRTILWSAVTLLFSTLVVYAVFHSIGISIDIPSAIIISSLVNWSMVLSITPAGLGIREGLIVVGAQITGYSVEGALVVSLLIRGVTIATTALLSMYYGPRLLKGSPVSYLKKSSK